MTSIVVSPQIGVEDDLVDGPPTPSCPTTPLNGIYSANTSISPPNNGRNTQTNTNKGNGGTLTEELVGKRCDFSKAVDAAEEAKDTGLAVAPKRYRLYCG
jgi:hypothetical protein